MKKHYLIITALIFTAVVFFGVSINNVKATSETTAAIETEPQIYVLKDYKGRLAIFENNNDIPIRVFDIFTSSLPKKDAEMLKNGIRVNYKDVPKTLEEYIS